MRKLFVAAMVVAAAVSMPTVAGASEGNADFGRHVVTCVHEHGFDGAHNPGMHQGAAGWDGASR